MPVTLRKSYNTVNKIYFFTATIHKWLPLLAEENNRQLVINYLQKHCNDGLLTVYGFVIMPDHLHIILAMVRASRTICFIVENCRPGSALGGA